MSPVASSGLSSGRLRCSSCWTGCARRSASAEAAPCWAQPARAGGSSGAPERQVPHLVPETLAAALEARGRALGRARDKGTVGGEGAQAGDRGERLEHLQSVGLPVGGQAQHAAGDEAAGEQVRERVLDEAALVVTLLRPGVGEEDEDLLQPLRGDLLPEHLDRIVTDGPHVRERARLEAEQYPPDPRAMHLDAQEILARISGGEGEQGLAV